MTEPPPQRWERPLPKVPGQWKKQLATRYLALAARGDLPALRALLAAQPAVLNQRGAHGRTLLWEAARRGRLETVRWLLEQGAEVDATGCYNNESLVQLTPYCAAVYYQRPAVADCLLARGAQLDIFRAAFLGQQDSVAQTLSAQPGLLVAEDPHDPIYYIPVLAFAVAGGHAALVDDLLQRGAPVAPYSALLLHLAARAARLDLVQRLAAAGADARAVDAGLFVAADDLAVLRWLLEQGASATRPGKSRQTPLALVTRRDKRRRPQVAALLREFGAEN